MHGHEPSNINLVHDLCLFIEVCRVSSKFRYINFGSLSLAVFLKKERLTRLRTCSQRRGIQLILISAQVYYNLMTIMSIVPLSVCICSMDTADVGGVQGKDY